MSGQAGVREGMVRAGAEALAEAAQRRRLAWRAFAFFALVALLGVLWPGEQPAAVVGHRRTSLHPAADSFYALHGLLRRLGYGVDRLRWSYAKLPPPATTLLLCLDPLPHARLADLYDGIEIGQARLLAEWVRAGGRLLVTWPGRQREPAGGDLLAPAEPGRADVVGTLFETVPGTEPTVAGGMLRGVGELAAIRQAWPTFAPAEVGLVAAHLHPGAEPRVPSFRRPLPEGWRPVLWLDEAPILLERTLGQGRVWAASTPLLFGALALARQDTALAVVSLLHAASEEGGRSIVFDEFVHGQRQARSLWWFVRHGPLAYPVSAALLLLVLLGWRGAVRLGPPQPDPAVPRRAKEEFVIGIAALAQRARHARAAGVAMLRSSERAVSADAEKSVRLQQLAQRLYTARPFGDKDLVALAAAIDAIVRPS